jgi:hypothetical protein
LTVCRDTATTASFTVFRVVNNANFVLSGVTVSGGRTQSNSFGGGIYNDATSTLTVNACHITGNIALGAARNLGGGISNAGGRLFINRSTISNNVVITDSFYPGGVYKSGPEAVIRNSTISGNTVVNASGSNTSNYNGSGIFADIGRALTIRSMTMTDNGAVGANSASGIYSAGTMNLGNTIVAETGAIRPYRIQRAMDSRRKAIISSAMSERRRSLMNRPIKKETLHHLLILCCSRSEIPAALRQRTLCWREVRQ